MTSASSRGCGVLFPYAAGNKLSAAAVDRGVTLILPFGRSPAASSTANRFAGTAAGGPSIGGDADAGAGGTGDGAGVAAAVVVDGATGEATAADDDADAPFCVCRRTWREDASFSLACSDCDEWFHAHCLGLEVIGEGLVRDAATGKTVDVSGDWRCPSCDAKQKQAARWEPAAGSGAAADAGASGSASVSSAGAAGSEVAGNASTAYAPGAAAAGSSSTSTDPVSSTASAEPTKRPRDAEGSSEQEAAAQPQAKRPRAGSDRDAAAVPRRSIKDFFAQR